MRESPDPGGLPRRHVLRALALAPAAIAGCAAGRAERAAPAAAAAGATDTPASAPPAVRAPSEGAVAAVRGFRLPADAEPAFVFRAAAARPGEPR